MEISSLSTAYGEEYLLIQNQGDDPADVYDVVLDETWVGAVQVLLGDVATDVPFYGLPPQESLIVKLRGAGTSLPEGVHTAGGAVRAPRGHPEGLGRRLGCDDEVWPIPNVPRLPGRRPVLHGDYSPVRGLG